VHIKFKGHTEANNAAGWRYGFVAVKADGVSVRYGAMHADNESETSFQLRNDETRLYFVVMGAPLKHHSYAWEAGWPKIKRYPYELTIENARPEGFQTGFRSEYKVNGHTHLNGGGWVANTASVAPSVYVGPKAVVLGNAQLSGQVRIDGTAWVEDAIVRDSVVIDGNANVWKGTYSNTVHITGNAIVNDCMLYGNAVVKDNALEWGVSLSNAVIAGGDAEISNCHCSGSYLQVPHGNNTRSHCDGKGRADVSNQDVNVALYPFTNEQMRFSQPRQEAETHAITVYPNPLQSRFTVRLHHFSHCESPVLLVYDRQVREVVKKELKAGRMIELNTGLLHMGKGTYLIRVVSGKVDLMKKMVVMN
jgi:hypothetical protein